MILWAAYRRKTARYIIDHLKLIRHRSLNAVEIYGEPLTPPKKTKRHRSSDEAHDAPHEPHHRLLLLEEQSTSPILAAGKLGYTIANFNPRIICILSPFHKMKTRSTTPMQKHEKISLAYAFHTPHRVYYPDMLVDMGIPTAMAISEGAKIKKIMRQSNKDTEICITPDIIEPAFEAAFCFFSPHQIVCACLPAEVHGNDTALLVTHLTALVTRTHRDAQ